MLIQNLKTGDRVVYHDDDDAHPPLRGTVLTIDEDYVTIDWIDGTTTTAAQWLLDAVDIRTDQK